MLQLCSFLLHRCRIELTLSLHTPFLAPLLQVDGLESVLSKCPLFEDCSAHFITQVCRVLQLEEFKTHDLIISHDTSRSPRLIFLMEGSADLLYFDKLTGEDTDRQTVILEPSSPIPAPSPATDKTNHIKGDLFVSPCLFHHSTIIK